MSGRVSRKIRQETRRLWREHINNMGKLPFRERLWYAWHIVKGR